LKTWIKYGIVNAIIGLIVGIFIAITTIGEGYYVFAIAAPLAAFIVGGLFWNMIAKNEYNSTKIIITGLLTGSVSHYVTFVLLSIGMNICYWTTGECTGSLGEPPVSILSALRDSFVFSFFSLLFFGWITIPYAIAVGFIIMKINKSKNIT
jgi:type III secretory pathway component EscS